jgi:hypothetical protein
MTDTTVPGAMARESAAQPRAVCDPSGKRWRVECDDWTMQPTGLVSVEQARAICETTAAALAAISAPEAQREGLAGRLAELNARLRVGVPTKDSGDGVGWEYDTDAAARTMSEAADALALHATSQPLPQEGGRVPEGWRPQPVPVDRLIEEGRTTQLRQRLHDELYAKARIAALNDTAGFLLAMGHEKHRKHVLGAASLIAELAAAPQPPLPSGAPDALAKQVPEEHSIEDVLTDFATREGNPYVRLHDFVAKFPQYAKELVEMAEELSLDAQNRLVRVKTDNGIEIYDPWFPSAPRIICRAAIAQAETGKAGAGESTEATTNDKAVMEAMLEAGMAVIQADPRPILDAGFTLGHVAQIYAAMQAVRDRAAPSPEPSRQGVEAPVFASDCLDCDGTGVVWGIGSDRRKNAVCPSCAALRTPSTGSAER